MLALAMAALMVGTGTAPLRLDRPATSRQALYRIGPQQQAKRAYRATPILDALVGAPRLRGRGRHAELQVANLSFAVEGRRRGHGGRVGSSGWTDTPRGLRASDWRGAKELAFAVAVDWAREGGRWRLGGGIDRLSLGNASLSGGRTGAAIRVAAVDYVADAGWSIGGGWRTTSATAQRYGANRLAALALGAPPVAAGGFIAGTVALADGSSLRLEGASARLGADDARLLGGATDRRITLSLRQAFQ